MKDEDSLKGLVDERTVCGMAGMSPEVLERYEKAGYAKWEKMKGGIRYYSENTVEILKAMTLCLGRCANLQEAHEMALQGSELKRRRNSEADTSQNKTIDPRKIKTHPRFKGLLSIDEDLEENLTTDMAVGGYYTSQPVVLATWLGQEEPVLIDGHTRVQAAIKAGVDTIPYTVETFSDMNGALEYVAKVQTHRRPTDDWVRYQLIIELDSLMDRGGDRRSEQAKSKGSQDPIETKSSTSAERTGALVGCSPSTVKRARRINREGWPSLLEALKKGEKTITQAEKAIAEKIKGEAGQSNGEQASDAESENSLVHVESEYREILSQVEGTLHEKVNKACKMYIWWLRQKGLLPKE